MAAGSREQSLGTQHVKATAPKPPAALPGWHGQRSSAGFDEGWQHPSHSQAQKALSLCDRSLLLSCRALQAGHSLEIGHKLEKGK